VLRSILVLVAAAPLLLVCGCPQEQAANSTTTPGGDTKPGDKPADKPADKPVKVENWWKGVGKGSVAEYKMSMNMTKPAPYKSDSTIVKTLDSKDDKGYLLKVVTTSAGNATPSDEPGTWDAAAAAPDPKTTTKDLGKQKIKAEGGEFECEGTESVRDDAGTKTTSETWTHHGLLVKMTTKSEGAS